jgi:hypothetical protein
MSEDILTELKADWMECACYEGSLSVDREVLLDAADEIERQRAERRERIATACLAALLSHDGWERMSMPYLVQNAVGYADELIAELGREATP